MAAKYGLTGQVDNRTDGVVVMVNGDLKSIDRFSNDILQNAPPASEIKSIEINTIQLSESGSFRIAESRSTDDQVTEISPDIAVCKDCLDDLDHDPGRINYPFINCTNCGPRFTIIEDLPYDRKVTSMKVFRMCRTCNSEYNDILDRRFHAQPIACNSCGPVYHFRSKGKAVYDIKAILDEVAFQIESGKSIAVKGMGGYHLMCDAVNEEAVSRLRKNKQRDLKPFAVMFRDLRAAMEFCYIDDAEEKQLKSWRRPIVILRQKRELSPSVSNGLKTTGAMLPYMPFHYMLFRNLKTPAIILTSGNISDEPIITDDRIAGMKLKQVADSILAYNRRIVNRTDDSVIRLINKKPSVIRRSRGYVPRPVDLKYSVEGIFAAGAEQKNTFCIGRGSQAIMSQYIGDLRNQATYDFYSEAVGRFSKLFRFRPTAIACDLHPDYLSTTYAGKISEELNLPLVRVQHHHAHIVSCMAENNIDEDVIGVSLDGTGYGTDGNIWGGEFLISGLEKFTRFSHFDYIPLPGGDKVIDEPWRTAYSYIYSFYGKQFDYDSIPAFRNTGISKLTAITEMIDKKINSPLSSGAGRLFDALAAILGVCTTSSFDSEGPMRLESATVTGNDDFYPFTTGRTVRFRDTFDAVLKDMTHRDISVISTRFHNTVAQVILKVSREIRAETSINKVILSGGVFQNKYLLEKCVSLLRGDKFRIFSNNIVPANDGGISLGQIVIASKLKR